MRNQACRILKAYKDYKRHRKVKRKGIELIRDNSFSIIVDGSGPCEDKEKGGNRQDEGEECVYQKAKGGFNCRKRENTESNQEYCNNNKHTSSNQRDYGVDQRITNEDIMNLFGINCGSRKNSNGEEEDDDQLSFE